MIKKLPYKLTDGAFATKDGLVVVMLARSPFLEMKDDAFRCNGIEKNPDANSNKIIREIPWKEAARFILPREGSLMSVLDKEGIISHCFPYDKSLSETMISLHSYAVILCDDAEAFCILHWCIHNLGGKT